jgi:hypothetical protein
LPTGLQITNPAVTSNTCGGTPTAPASGKHDFSRGRKPSRRRLLRSFCIGRASSAPAYNTSDLQQPSSYSL